MSLAAGSYFVAPSQFDNFPLDPNFANGFLEGGNIGFTAAFGCAAGILCDISGNSRTGNFDLSISGDQVAPSSAVPEPATLALLGLGLAGLGFSRRKR